MKHPRDGGERCVPCPHKVSTHLSPTAVCSGAALNGVVCVCVCAGLQQDVPGQCGTAQTLAHPWPTCACLCRVWQGFCGKLQTQAAPAGAHRREALPGGRAGRGGAHLTMDNLLIASSCVVPISAHLRAAASGSHWTSTCALTCGSTPGTAPTSVPLRPATSGLPSRPTSSPTCSRMQSHSDWCGVCVS